MDRPLEPQNRRGKHIGWALLVALVFAVSIAISLAVQLNADSSSPPRPVPPCGGMFDQCCDDWEDEFDRTNDDWDGRDGLFDAEEHFADRPDDVGGLPARC